MMSATETSVGTRPAAEILPVRVDRVENVALNVRRVSFRRLDGAEFPRWEPGSHIDVIMPEHVRQYSLCSSPSQTDVLQIAVLRAPESRGGSAWVHDMLREGQELTISAPRNNFPFRDSPRYLFLAGGIGITALLPMIEAAEAAGRDWRLVYGGRYRRNMAFVDELQARWPDRVSVHASREGARLDLDAVLAMPRAKMHIYACGPESMLEEIEDWCLGWPPGVLHVERFLAANLDAGSSLEPFRVELVHSGTSVTVSPGQSVLEAIESAGVRVLSSCRAGVCGTCETEVLNGEVEHRDAILSPAERAEGRSMMVCVSRAAAGCPSLRLDL